MESPPSSSTETPIYNLPQDTLHQIFSTLPLRDIITSRTLSKFFLHLLSSPSFLHLLSTTPPLSLLALRHHNHHHNNHHHLHLFDPNLKTWFHFPLNFLPFLSPLPVASSHGLIYLWAQPTPSPSPGPSPTTSQTSKSLIACNPLTRQFRVLPNLGSAWCRHGAVLVEKENRVLVLTELAALYFPGRGGGYNYHPDGNNYRQDSGGYGGYSGGWLKFSSNLPSKPRSPVLINDSAYALCDVGSPWRSQWKLFSCRLGGEGRGEGVKGTAMAKRWLRIERNEWGDVFDILKRPRLVRGEGNRILMIGGLKSSFLLNSPCSTILILRLDLESMEWDEAGRMPLEMFRCFQEAGKFKVFGGGSRVCFSAKRIGKLALWDRCAVVNEDVWRWIDNVPGNCDGLYRGFVFEGRLDVLP